MRKLKIEVWQRIPYAPDEEPGMPTYRIAGTITGTSGVVKRLFICNISMEIDGRDGDVEHIAGVNLAEDQDMWEMIHPAIAECPELMAAHQQATDEYYTQAK